LAVLVEGYLDAIMAHHYGIDTVVATLGTAVTAQHVDALRRLAPRLVFALDADAAGMRAVERSAQLFEGSGIDLAVASFPSGMDPDTFIRAYGPNQFRERIDNAVGVVEFRLAVTLQSADLSSQAGKTVALQECTKILAAIPSPLLRDRYVDDLTRLWVGAQATGDVVLDNIDVMRDELARQVRSAFYARKQTAPHRVATLSPAQIDDETAKAEETFLACLIHSPTLIRTIPAGMHAAMFREPIHRAIFSMALEIGSVDRWLAEATDPEMARAGARLAMRANEELPSEAMAFQRLFTDCAAKVVDYAGRRRLLELLDRFKAASVEGASAIEPQEIEEYYRLQLHFKSGRAGSEDAPPESMANSVH
jgi:DNA primase